MRLFLAPAGRISHGLVLAAGLLVLAASVSRRPVRSRQVSTESLAARPGAPRLR